MKLLICSWYKNS